MGGDKPRSPFSEQFQRLRVLAYNRDSFDVSPERVPRTSDGRDVLLWKTETQRECPHLSPLQFDAAEVG